MALQNFVIILNTDFKNITVTKGIRRGSVTERQELQVRINLRVTSLSQDWPRIPARRSDARALAQRGAGLILGGIFQASVTDPAREVISPSYNVNI